ncbi:YhgE/Pip domain-containing protein [Gemella massiliensis]|uniref:YhgE/Pip domain-containing protein n=1 Tax=Gemella massiliensis TaxID=1909670 RepID=UPI0009309AB7|nr:YhgE/Pip domain-containing protein [Gemella massiliensis]
MIEKEFKHLLKSKKLLVSLSLVALVPILYAGTFLKSVWTPYDNTSNLKVAVVNTDKPIDFNGKRLEIGQSMVDKLKENKKINWQFVDKDTAEKELREGDYYMIVTIPVNFSKNATTLSNENPEKMNIDFKTNFTKSKNGEKIMETVASNLTNTVKDQVVKTYSSTLYNKLSDIGISLSKAANGSGQLADGLSKLNDGGKRLGNGVDQLHNGSGQLAGGLSKLNDGGKRLGNGIDQLHNGSGQLTGGLSKLNDGSKRLGNGIDQLHNGSRQLAGGLSILNGKKDELANGIDLLFNGDNKLHSGLLQYTNGILTLNEKLFSKKDNLNSLINGGNSLAYGISRYTEGVRQIGGGLDAKQEDLTKLLTGGIELANGINTLADGVPKLSNGAYQIANGLDLLNRKLPSDKEIADNKAKLSSLTEKLQYLKISSRQLNSSISSKFEKLGNEITKLEKLIDKTNLKNNTTTTTVKSTDVSFSSLKQQLNSTSLTEEQKTAILNAAKSDVSNSQISTVNNTEINNNNDIKVELAQIMKSYQDLHKSLERLGKLGKEIDKVDVGNIKTQLLSLVDGYSNIKAGVNPLAVGSSKVKEGLSVMNQKTPRLTNGFSKYKTGVDETVTSLTSGKLANGIKELISKSPQLTSGFERYKNGVDETATSLTTGEMAQGIKRLADNTFALQKGSTDLNRGLRKLKSKIPELSIGIQKLDDGGQKLYKGISDMKARTPELLNGIQKLDDGGQKLYKGIDGMKAKTPELLNGIQKLNNGGQKLYKGIGDMKAKTPELINGMQKAKEGSDKLATGLVNGATQLNTAHTGDKNSDMLANPIKTNTSDIANETSYGNALAPFFLVFGLLIGAVIFNILYPIYQKENGIPTLTWFISKLSVMVIFSLLEVVIEVISMKLFFDFKVEYFGMYFSGLLLSAIIFMIIAHFFTFTFGKIGNIINISLVALQFVLTTPLFPRQMLPALYNGLIPFTPIYYADMSVKHAVLGGLTNNIYNNSMLVLTILGIVFLVLNYIFYTKKNRTMQTAD